MSLEKKFTRAYPPVHRVQPPSPDIFRREISRLPKGETTLAQPFKAGNLFDDDLSPKGTAESGLLQKMEFDLRRIRNMVGVDCAEDGFGPELLWAEQEMSTTEQEAYSRCREVV